MGDESTQVGNESGRGQIDYRPNSVYIESGRCGCRPLVFAWREGVTSPAGKPGKPPGPGRPLLLASPVRRGPTPLALVRRPHFACN